MKTNKEKRDFIAAEISKRLIGPGYTEGVFACQDDASDEILDNRPIVVYTGGILYPQKSSEPQEVSDENEDIAFDYDVDVLTTDNTDLDSTETEQNDDSDFTRFDKESNQLDLGISDRADFKPSHIGIIACVDEGTQSVNVDVSYGIYHMLNDSSCKEDNEVLQNVKVKLGRCSIQQLKETFKYYDSYTNLLAEIGLFGAHKMDDLFYVDEENLTISPRRIFKRTESNKNKFLQATSFPDLSRNKVAGLLIKLMNNPSTNYSLPVGLDWQSTSEEIKKIEVIPTLSDVLSANQWHTIIDNLSYDSQKNTVRITYGSFTIPEGVNLSSILYVDDPVKTHLLPLLLQYRYFKREQKTLETFSLPLEKSVGHHPLPDSNETLKLHWKTMQRVDGNGYKHRYVQILLENIKQKSSKQLSEDFVHQAQLKVSSPGIVSYSEPHRSSIADIEYDINEILYSDIKVYAKGVNCGAKWNISNDIKEVMTTYTPEQLAVAFDPESKDETVKNACNVFDLTIWSTFSKKQILDRFYAIANAYEAWHDTQRSKASGNHTLNRILKEQEEFLERFRDNIDYLDRNDDSYKCFQIANTAMYIQMVISRDPYFKKNREKAIYTSNDLFDDNSLWNRFETGAFKLTKYYRPFQLAFLLMNVKSTFENDDTYRNDNVDLIWFPTGGGKTEAYLALTALTIAYRRQSSPDDNGISVIMRYTLRLLTAQQFERASFLICALEYLRHHILNDANYQHYSLGNSPITIGMWIGKASSPNRFEDLNSGRYDKFKGYLIGRLNNVSSINPFPISYCPWCGCKMIAPGINGRFFSGYDRIYDTRNRGNIHCINNSCCFFDDLPIMFIDEQLYSTPPTLLFATVDKFAQLKDKETGEMFGCRIQNRRKPDLIIQDELHLISGPLGSLVGMYETMVEEVCTERDALGNIIRKPKVIASTATTRNTQNLIKQLYTRNVRSFPTLGVRYDDNFFSKSLPLEKCKRLYIGISPTGHSAGELEIRAIASQIVAKEKLISEELKSQSVDLNEVASVTSYLMNDQVSKTLLAELDNYWTLVLYYNNLKSLGRAHSRIGQEIKSNAESMRVYLEEYPSLDFICGGFHHRTEEFTSRQESSRIKELLVEAESRTALVQDVHHRMRVTSNMDIVQATNMISVGIDIERWNTMIIVGQPLTTAEYIQSSSRVGRTVDGLVINLYNPLRLRELSLYENYLPYHNAFYKHVEPLMATTFTEQTVNKLATNLYLCYMGAVKGYTRNDEVTKNDLQDLKDILTQRGKKVSNGKYFSSLAQYMIEEIDKVSADFASQPNLSFKQFIQNREDLSHSIMNSLRDIESNTYIYYDI